MRLISHDVELHLPYMNRPDFSLVVDRIPDISEMRFEERDGCYFAELDGYVMFFYYVAPGEGFGGSVFTITMTDGSEVKLYGPWSSRSAVMNARGFPESVEAVLSAKDGPPFRVSAHVSVEWLKQNGVPVVAMWHGWAGRDAEPAWEPADENGNPVKTLDRYASLRDI